MKRSAREEDNLDQWVTDQGKDQIIVFHRHHEEFCI